MTRARDLRILIAGDDPLARSALLSRLHDGDGIEVVGETAADPDLPRVLDRLRPDVVLWDLGLDVDRSAEIFAQLAELDFPIVGLVPYPRHAATIAASGASGVLLRDAGADELRGALEAVARGFVVFHRDVAREIVRAPATAVDSIDPLTPREIEVLHLMAEGLPNKLIADRLGISEHTVKFHVNAILTKLGAQGRTEAVVRAARLGLIIL
jgi:DNA-binding NarL/FixJ family response regulator